MEKVSPFYLSIKPRFKSFSKSTLISTYPQYTQHYKNIAILMQGPLNIVNNFTCQTLALYRHIYPNITIILSTWHNQDPQILAEIEQLGVEVILNDYPLFNGTQNVNFQITTTVNGLKYLKTKNVEYVLKTRTDQRCYESIDFLAYFLSLSTCFPIKVPNCKLAERLIICSINTFIERLYGVTDMFMFGTIDDMILYWDVPLQLAPITLTYTGRDLFVKNNIAEGYFINEFFKTINFTPTWEKINSDLFFNEYFMIVNKEQIDLFWLKYDRFIETWPKNDDVHRPVRSFGDWMLFKGYSK
jgi:hypothetical protein